MRALLIALTFSAIILIGSLPLLTVQAKTPSKAALEFTLTPKTGAVGSYVVINGNLTIYGSPPSDNTIDFYFGKMPSPIAVISKAMTNASFQTGFNVPLVNDGTYSIFATDKGGTNQSQTFTVTFGVNTLIADLQKLETNQNLTASSLMTIMNHLNSLGSSSQVNSLSQSISSLSASVSASNNSIQSLFPLLVLFVALEGVLIGLVVASIMIQRRRRSPMSRPEDVEVVES